MQFVIKFHTASDGKVILVICDKELVGKKFEEGNKILDLSTSFHKGEIVSKEKVIKSFAHAYIINATGKHSTDLLIDEGLVDNIVEINKIPHTECVIDPS